MVLTAKPYVVPAAPASGTTSVWDRDVFRAHVGAVAALGSVGIQPPAEWSATLRRYQTFDPSWAVRPLTA